MIERIVVINDISTPKGGATALAIASAMAYRRRGLPVTFLTGDAGDNAAMRDLGIHIVALGAERLLSGSVARATVNGLYNRAAHAMVAGWIAANDTPGCVYHIHGWSQILSPALFGAVRPVAARLVCSAHDFFLACPNGAFAFLRSGAVCSHRPLSLACTLADCDRRNRTQKLWRIARQHVLRRFFDPARSPPVLAIHAAMRPFLMRAGIPDAAIVDLPNPVRPWCAERVEAERNADVLFVGRIEETKGADLAAAAARRAGLHLRLAGDGAMRARLEAEYPEFTFLGHLSPPEIAAAARTARMLVMPSRYPEPFGLVAAEALWSGLPLIANDTAFLAGDIVRAGAGLAVEPRDISAFAAALRKISDDDELARRMSLAAIGNTADIALSPDVWIDRLLEIYASRL